MNYEGEATKLYKKYKQDLLALQNTCKHELISDWTDEWWAPGHKTHRSVKACLNCNKIVNEKIGCSHCFETFVKDKMIEGDGIKGPAGSYCKDCYPVALSQWTFLRRKKGFCRCGAEATFSNPEVMCDQHWAEWWVNGLNCTNKTDMVKNILRLIQAGREAQMSI